MKKTLLYFITVPIILFGNEAGGLSFLNIPPSGNSASLGNTMTADLFRPTSLLQNPANIWQNSLHTFSSSYRSVAITETSYINLFYGRKIKDLTFCLGVVQYGIKKIEEYDNEANFLGYFNFQNWAIALGTSWRASGMLFGLGISGITQDFTQIAHERENFIGLDIGITMMDLLYKNNYDFDILNKVDLTVSYVNKLMFTMPEFAQVSSASSNNILGFKALVRQNSFSFAIYSDLVINTNTEMVTWRAGLQPQINFKYEMIKKAGLNVGVNRLPLNRSEDFYKDTFSEYSRKFSIGVFFEFILPVIRQKILINYAYELHKILPESHYITVEFIFEGK